MAEKIDRNYKVQTNQMYLKDAYEMSLLFDRRIIENTNDLLEDAMSLLKPTKCIYHTILYLKM